MDSIHLILICFLCIIRKDKHNRSSKVAVQGLDFVAYPLYVHKERYIYGKTMSAYSYVYFLAHIKGFKET
jgi:hypothetical protein